MSHHSGCHPPRQKCLDCALLFFPLGSPAPTPASSVCLSELRVPASLPVPCGRAPPRGRPGQGLGLPCLDTSRNSAALKGPAWLGLATMGPLCPARGLLQQAAHRFPGQPQPQPAPHISAIPPQAPVPTLGAGILPRPLEGRAWESHAARPGNWFCRVPWAVLPGREPGGLQGQEPGRMPCTGCDISVSAIALKQRGSWPHFTARATEAGRELPASRY